MKKYRVVVSTDAKQDLGRCRDYLKNVKRSPSAAKNVVDDFHETRKSLEMVAGSLQMPQSEILSSRGLRRMNFLRHNYFLLYRLEDDMAIVTNVFHGLEDFENKLR